MSNPYNRHVVQDGNYDWLHPNETQTQYIFHLRDDAPFEKKSFGVVVNNLAEDFDTVYECAEALLGEVEEYGYHPDKEKVKKLVAYLYEYMYLDRLATLEEDKRKILRDLDTVNERIEFVKSEMSEYPLKGVLLHD